MPQDSQRKSTWICGRPAAGHARCRLFAPPRTALIFCLRSSTSLQYSTGAAHITFLVKQPAATAGSSATTRDRSAFLPDARREAYTPAQANSVTGQEEAALVQTGNSPPVLHNAQPAAADRPCPAFSQQRACGLEALGCADAPLDLLPGTSGDQIRAGRDLEGLCCG